MSALEALKHNLHFARALIVDGRDRYLGVTRTAFSIEQIYRKYRNRAKVLSAIEAESVLKEAHRESADLICDLCKENGAIWVKFAQFLSCRPDILPIEYIFSLQIIFLFFFYVLPDTFLKNRQQILPLHAEMPCNIALSFCAL